ncbi:MAG: oligopeptide/dipeptide ABC transporter ATP-binding protein [Candidatus Faecousia sp.]|nr:oligopeptide/dipeptide ABC transporter ATP-binding protein [Candidatus Faecousia sp.]
MQNNEKKLLLQIQNLKQYFPVGKGRFVRANDGISLDIYEGETLGLVGESGCGKSTLGRSILQLYKQTDGRTMYFGRTIDELAPKYAHDTFRSLTKRHAQMLEKKAKYEHFRAEYDKLPEKEQYQKHAEMVHLRKEAKDAVLDVTTLIGGLFAHPELSKVEAVFCEQYKISQELSAALEKRTDLDLDVADADFQLNKAKETGNPTQKLSAKAEAAHAKMDAMDKEIAAIRERLAEGGKKIAALREECRNQPDYDVFEADHSEGIDLARLSYNEMRKLRSDLQLIFQDPYSSLNPRMTVGQIVGEGMVAHKYYRKNDERMQEGVIKVMEDCGLAPYFIHRYPHQFSGGQRQRIGIARSLAVQPKFVVCDEAVSALDVSIQAQIINLLQDLKEKKNLTYLFITHDLSVVKYISDRIGVMYLGNMVEIAPSDDIFAHPLHPYTEALLNAIPTTDEDVNRNPEILQGDIPSPVNPPKGCKFHTRCKYCTEICTQVQPEFEEVRPNHFVACHHILEQGE